MSWKELLTSWNLTNLIDIFEDEEIDDESFSLLDYDNVCRIIKKAGPRMKFWNFFTGEFRNIVLLNNDNSSTRPNSNVSDFSSIITIPEDIISKSGVQNNANPGLTHDNHLVRLEAELEGSESCYIEVADNTYLNTTCSQADPSSSGLLSFVNDNNLSFLRPRSTVNDYLLAVERKSILNFYTHHNCVDEYHRNKLVNVIVGKDEVGKFTDELDFRVTTERFHELTAQIITLFPTESKEVYYTPYSKITKKKASGKIWEKVQTFKKNLRRGKTLTKKNSLISNSKVEQDERLQSEETDQKLKFLEKNLEPQTKIKEFWHDTVDVRSELFKHNINFTISHYLDRFLILRSADGYVYLIDDFQHCHRESADNLYKKWPEFNEKIITLAESKNKKSINNILINKYGHLGFFLLPHLLATPTRKRKSTGIGRYSNQESAYAFITLVPETVLVHEELHKIRTRSQQEKTTVQPTLIFVGENISNVIDTYLAIDYVLFKCKGPLDAIDSCFKSFTALNAKFPDASEHVWFLFQRLIYEITTPWDKNFITVSSLLVDLK